MLKRSLLKRLAMLLVCVLTVSGVTALSYAGWSNENDFTQDAGLNAGGVIGLKLAANAIAFQDPLNSNADITAAVNGRTITLIPVDEADAVAISNANVRRYLKVVVTVDEADAAYKLYISTAADLDEESSLRFHTAAPTAGASYDEETGTEITSTAAVELASGTAITEPAVATHTFYIFLESDEPTDAGKALDITVSIRYA